MDTPLLLDYYTHNYLLPYIYELRLATTFTIYRFTVYCDVVNKVISYNVLLIEKNFVLCLLDIFTKLPVSALQFPWYLMYSYHYIVAS